MDNVIWQGVYDVPRDRDERIDNTWANLGISDDVDISVTHTLRLAYVSGHSYGPKCNFYP